MYDGIEYRGYGQQRGGRSSQKYAGVPVWNGLTTEFHPTQVLADLLTIQEKFGKLKGIKMAYCGDARFNMGNSLMVGCAKMGLDFVACAPKQYFPQSELTDTCKALAKQSGGSITQTEDVLEGVKGADVIYTDVWVSMGEPMEIWEERIRDLAPYQVNAKVMAAAKPGAIFMHCLPSFHDLNTAIGKEMGARFGRDSMEVSPDVFDSKQSVVFDEAENRMHTIKAIMLATL